MEAMTEGRSWSDDRLDGLDCKVDEGFRRMDRQFEAVDKQFEQVDRRFDRIEGAIDGLRNEISAMNRSMAQFAVILTAALIGVVGTLAGLIVTQL
jgi:archaellum component FlaC